jgi:hypothetical protein
LAEVQMQRADIAKDVAVRLLEAEDAIDSALKQT